MPPRPQVRAGSLVLLHGANVHLSKENTSPLSRHAYAMHFVEGAPGYDWQPTNWLQRRADLPFEPLYDRSSSGAAPAMPPAYRHVVRPGAVQRAPAAAPAPGPAAGARPY